MAYLRVSPLAVRDVTSIANYIAQDRPAASRRVGRAFYKTFGFLAKHPHVGTAREDVRAGLRLFIPEPPADRYIVFFQYDSVSDTVEIGAVIDGSRDWENILGDSAD